jgi:hypothetical protein
VVFERVEKRKIGKQVKNIDKMVENMYNKPYFGAGYWEDGRETYEQNNIH